jgi:hypothetical protein
MLTLATMSAFTKTLSDVDEEKETKSFEAFLDAPRTAPSREVSEVVSSSEESDFELTSKRPGAVAEVEMGELAAAVAVGASLKSDTDTETEADRKALHLQKQLIADPRECLVQVTQDPNNPGGLVVKNNRFHRIASKYFRPRNYGQALRDAPAKLHRIRNKHPRLCLALLVVIVIVLVVLVVWLVDTVFGP